MEESAEMNPESPVMHPQPQGFLAAAKNVGIKDETLDMTVIFSTVRARAAAMFTRNRFPGAPVIVGRAHISDGFAQSIVVNSKNANVATGQRGIEDAVEMCRLVAGELGIDTRDVLPFSTGVIGRPLPMDKIRAGQLPGPEMSIAKLASSQQTTRLSNVVAELLGPKITADTGEWGTYAWSQLLLGSPGGRIAGGSDEVMRNIVGERVLGLPKDPGIDSTSPFRDLKVGTQAS